MKRILISTLLVSACGFAGTSFAAAAVEKVIVRQQWPWSADVKVEYKLTGVTTPVNIGVTAYDGETELPPIPESAMRGDRYGVSGDGVGQFVIDPVAAFGTERLTFANFSVKLSLTASDPSESDVLYKVLDLTNFTTKDITRADFHNGKMGTYETDYGKIGEVNGQKYSTLLEDVLIWTGITNMPEYKLTKLAMRRIPAKDVTYQMGTHAGDWTYCGFAGTHDVTLKSDFYLSVFEVTEKQMNRLISVNGVDGVIPGVSSPTWHGDPLPVGAMNYRFLRGVPQDYSNWPADIYEVSSDSAIQKIRNNFPGMTFDVPTEAQWEYACRAGTVWPLYCGIPQQAATLSTEQYLALLRPLAWTGGQGESIPLEAELNQHQLGGLKHPNAFGLYDMLGNQWETCRDLVLGSPTAITTPAVEPLINDMAENKDAQYVMTRGGSYYNNYAYALAARRAWVPMAHYSWAHLGFRLFLKCDE